MTIISRLLTATQQATLTKHGMRFVPVCNQRREFVLKAFIGHGWLEIAQLHLPASNSELAHWIFVGEQHRKTVLALGARATARLACDEARRDSQAKKQARRNDAADTQQRATVRTQRKRLNLAAIRRQLKR